MAIGLVGQKLGMTRIMSEDGSATAVSVIKIEANRVVQTRTTEVDGYSAVQVTTGAKVNKKGEAKVRRVPSAIKGHYAKASQDIGLGLWEFRADADEIGDASSFDLSIFGAGHYVDVTGQSKGKGFQGGVKRHNFQMQDATHGNSISHRAIGSTGQCQEPGRVFKGKKMAGHMGDEQVTEECLEIIRVDSERNLLLVKGAIPGSKSGFVKVMLSAKKDKINSNISKQIQEQKDAQLAQEQEAKAAAEAEKAAAKEAKKVTSEANTTKDDGAETPKVETE
ncbi:MAG: 50S ribosomal protein L3 [Candidatus Thioglobus sp.]|jgi:large subunit ribosomal protein L3|nr:50S ribosomal protein L3 [Candidatus Thioglobus sp.]